MVERKAPSPELVPELDVTDLEASIAFYALLGFEVAYRRLDEGFAYLSRGAVHLMVQTADGPGRRFRTAELARPHGRGINFQLEVQDVAGLHDRVLADGHEPLLGLEDRWYRLGDHEAGKRETGNRQFAVADPDGYLWRPFQDLGHRSVV